MQKGDLIAERYELLSSLGEGGQGEVWLALPVGSELHEEVALKMLPAHADAARLRGEAEALKKIYSPHVVRTLDLVKDEGSGRLCLVMEHVPGIGLEQWLEENPHPTGHQILTIALHIAAGLGAVHEAEVVHRDLKPDNTMVEERDGGLFVRLIDFGFALDRSGPRNTREGHTLGTPPYMPLEQLASSGVTNAADLYAFGAILHRMLWGRPPVAGTEFGPCYAALLSWYDGGAPLPAEAAPLDELRPLVTKLLARERGQRGTAPEALEALRKLATATTATETGEAAGVSPQRPEGGRSLGDPQESPDHHDKVPRLGTAPTATRTDETAQVGARHAAQRRAPADETDAPASDPRPARGAHRRLLLAALALALAGVWGLRSYHGGSGTLEETARPYARPAREVRGAEAVVRRPRDAAPAEAPAGRRVPDGTTRLSRGDPVPKAEHPRPTRPVHPHDRTADPARPKPKPDPMARRPAAENGPEPTPPAPGTGGRPPDETDPDRPFPRHALPPGGRNHPTPSPERAGEGGIRGRAGSAGEELESP